MIAARARKWVIAEFIKALVYALIRAGGATFQALKAPSTVPIGTGSNQALEMKNVVLNLK
jgi:hypothetical protein